ncbi:MAG: Y-family DNA polymerase [Patescibacteria group bacterium]|jgi:DNA polymerase V
MQKKVALIDCNNFFVSCERLFNPQLKDKPIVVLSNNDGCIVSRSNEAKALGIAMGMPLFKCLDVVKKYDVQVFSSNFILYGDISHRVMDTLRQFSPEVEIYSIDEAFIALNLNTNQETVEYGKKIRETILKWVGVPVSVGISSTKTLAKAASEIAKKNLDFEGVLEIDKENVDIMLSVLPVGDVWGIGRQYARFLKKHAVETALDLRELSDEWVRKNLTVSGLKTVWELRGKGCIDFEHVPPARKSIISSRSFGKPVADYISLREAVASYTSIAAEKLRNQKLVASCVLVYITTNRFKEQEKQYSNSYVLRLLEATNDTSILVKHATEALKKIYKKGFKYKKAGVLLLDLVSENNIQANLFTNQRGKIKRSKLLHALDFINNRWGGNTVSVAAAGIKKPWKANQARKTGRLTTSWDELPKVKTR